MTLTRKLAALAATSTLALGLAACGGDPTDSTGSPDSQSAEGTITVGSAAFPENEILAEIYAQAQRCGQTDFAEAFAKMKATQGAAKAKKQVTPAAKAKPTGSPSFPRNANSKRGRRRPRRLKRPRRPREP